jgi:glycosyltransferase involved in cell wall biosynthesis
MNITLSAPINNTGYGVASMNILKGLVSLNNRVNLFPMGNPQVTNEEDKNIVEQCIKDRLDLLDINAPYIKIWHQFDLLSRIGRGKYFGFPFFELDTLNSFEIKNLNVPDAIIVASSWAKEVIKNSNISVPTYVVPLGVDTKIFNYLGDFPKLDFKNSDKYVFLNIGKWEVRKGHDILLELFNAAFPDEQDVELWILASENTNAYSNKEELAVWKNMYSVPRVRLFNGADTHFDIATLINSCDCGIYPSRAEGWNLELLETMAMNKPVIATDYSAHTEFCNRDNAFLADISDTEKAYDGKAFQGQGNWAKIDQKAKNQIVEYMRYLYKNRINTNKYGIETAKNYSWANAAEKLLGCIS